MEKDELKISVRSLIEYSLRSGSIDFQYTGAMRAVDGIIYHQKIQKKREKAAALGEYSYAREVSFKEAFDVEEMKIIVQGRADGIMKKDGRVYIEEIKTTVKPLALVTDNLLHIAQAKCYAYFYLLSHGELERIWVLLTYCNTETFEMKEYEYAFTLAELKEFFDFVLAAYARWAKHLIAWREARNQSIGALNFPYEQYRAGQREMSVDVYRAIERRRKIFLSAPTGIGKTISSLFPAVKAMARGKAEKLFYLTAKTITRQSALSAVKTMQEQGLAAKTLVITAKDKICFQETSVCAPESCPFADGHFDRINAALIDLLSNETTMDKEIVEQYARKHRVCPYEFSLDTALVADIIICDYNYAFDPRVYLRRFFYEATEAYVFLIDEAHNLVDRAREMYSAEIHIGTIKNAIKSIKKEGKVLKKPLNKIKELLLDAAEKITDEDYGMVYEEPPQTLYKAVQEYCRAADQWLSDTKQERTPSVAGYYEIVLDLYFEMNHFLAIWEAFDERCICYCEKPGRDILLRLYCIDPSARLREMLKNAVSSVFFSATLTPLKYFRDLLGAEETDYGVIYPSPFPKENIRCFAAVTVSTKYAQREQSYEQIADYIHQGAQAKSGNYFAFFPSYIYMEKVYEVFRMKYPQVRTMIQSVNMREEEKDSFLAHFREAHAGLIAFAVLGGMFSEGIDLPGEQLIGAFIISVGLPKLSFERALISSHFERTKGEGFAYAYQYPGMNKVAQAGGRVIRTMADRGMVVLIDQRYAYSDYRALLPLLWRDYQRVYTPEALAALLRQFWAAAPQPDTEG